MKMNMSILTNKMKKEDNILKKLIVEMGNQLFVWFKEIIQKVTVHYQAHFRQTI